MQSHIHCVTKLILQHSIYFTYALQRQCVVTALYCLTISVQTLPNIEPVFRYMLHPVYYRHSMPISWELWMHWQVFVKNWFHSLSVCLYRSAVSVRLLWCWVGNLYAACYTKAIFFIDSTILRSCSFMKCIEMSNGACYTCCLPWMCGKHHLLLKLSTEYICSCSVFNFHSKLVWFVSIDFVTMMDGLLV